MARPVRADSALNRAKILDAARTTLAVSGEATMQSVARAAGVGQGTLYRHFPTREALILEVHRRDVNALVDAAPGLLERLPPLQALRAWLDQLAEYGRVKHGLLDAVYATLHKQLDDEGTGPVLAAIQLMLDAGQAAGSVRSGLSAEDVLLLVGFLWRLDQRDSWPAQSARLLDVVMDALTVGRPKPKHASSATSPPEGTPT
jgi:AcrR family transcriptional regulator